MIPRLRCRQRGDAAGAAALVVLVLLGLSLAANAWLFKERDAIMQEKAATEQLRADTAAAAGACSSSVDRLAQEGRARDARLGAKLAAIAPRVARDQQAALDALRARPDDSKDLCGSLQRFLQRSIEAERKEAP